MDCSHNYRFKNAKALLAALKTAKATRTLGDFTFRNKNGTETHKVMLINMTGQEVGAKKNEGIYEVTLVAP